MLEHVPAWLGRALAGVRAGADKLVVARLAAAAPQIDLTSPAFADGGRLPPRFTADGEGISPPLTWGALPDGTARIALIVEDADAPAPQPLVHAVVWDVPVAAGRLAEGAVTADGDGGPIGDVGRNSFRGEGWLPPDPPTGHGEHRYVFQLFALDGGTPEVKATPGRAAVVEAMAGHVIAAGVLIGTYARGEPAPVATGGVAAPA